MALRFTKMHGIGNDYVYVDAVSDPAVGTRDDLGALSIAMSDRHRGVGSDGLILILPPEQGVDAHVRMRMFNADGSESEMCGNGIRCVAKFAHDHGLSRARPMRVQTGAGVLVIDYTTNGDGTLAAATVDMGEPTLEAGRIPVQAALLAADERVIDVPLAEVFDSWDDSMNTRWELDGRMTCVSMGNPHMVIYCDSARHIPLEVLGPMFETHPIFPRRVNVHFVEVRSAAEVVMRTWERGSGPTLACGTGACAVCVAGVLSGRTDRRLLTHLPGGDLELEWDDGSGRVFMTGPATEVFAGEWRDGSPQQLDG